MNTQQQLKEAYNKQAKYRDSAITDDWKTNEREGFLRVLQREKKTSLLEIGAGPGHDSLYFHQHGFHTFSTDLSPEMIAICKSKGLEAAEMSFYQLQFPDEQFDALYAFNCLLHVPKAELSEVLNELKRVIKPNGLFYLGVYGGRTSEGIWEEDVYEPKRFFSFYEHEPLQSLLSAFFSIESFNVIPSNVIGGDLAFQSIVLRKE
ncbi:methyltransferase [Bacillus sp. JCM 19047]|nr:methyltransferase [Bacillus sp. JCM 19047]